MKRRILFVAPEGAPELFNRVVVTLGEEIRPTFKNMELLPAGRPITDWTLDGEVRSLLAFANAEGLETFDLIGYSGGAAVSLCQIGLRWLTERRNQGFLHVWHTKIWIRIWRCQSPARQQGLISRNPSSC